MMIEDAPPSPSAQGAARRFVSIAGTDVRLSTSR